MTNFRDVTAALTELLQQDIGNPSSLDDLETFTLQMIRQILQHWLENSEKLFPILKPGAGIAGIMQTTSQRR